MANQAIKISYMLQDLALRKINIASKRALTCMTRSIVPPTCNYFHQSRRGGIAEKRARQRAESQAVKKKKIKAKKNIPILEIPGSISVGGLAVISKRTPEQIYHMKAIVEATQFKERDHYSLNVTLSDDTLVKIVKKLGYRPVMIRKETLHVQDDKDIHAQPLTTDETKLQDRPPIVAVMGHIDHGKTTILDALRRTTVASNEAGGITQSIGAFSVPLTTEKTATFLDTPGHSVFTSMRERGAKVTDIVVLVVAADDGVMEQTIESINMAKMAEATIVVALNKCDKQGADPDLVVQDLDNHGIKCEQLGGNVPAIRISALKNIGLDKLVESVITEADKLELKYDPDMQVQGFVLESKNEKGRGNLVSVIVKQGTLEVGKVIIAGTNMSKVKLLLDANDKKLSSVRPGEAANVMGWKSLPDAGQVVLEAESELKAKAAIRQREREMRNLESDDILREINEKRKVERKEYDYIRQKHRGAKYRAAESFRLAQIKNKIDDTTPSLNIIVKADVDGSMEAILKVLDSYSSDEQCHLNLTRYGIGDLKASEYELAKQFGATIYLFNTEISADARKKLDESVTIVQHRVIYHLVDDLLKRLTELLPPVDKLVLEGEAEVLQKFTKSKKQVVGCRVLSGTLHLEENYAVLRDGSTVHKGTLESMRKHGSPITEITAGNECGMVFTDDADIAIGDNIQCYSSTPEKQKLSWRPPGF